MWKIIVLLNFVAFCFVVFLNSEEIFNSVINKLTKNSGCTTNIQLITQYINELKNNSLQIRKPRYMKNDLNKYLWKSEFQNSFEGFDDLSLVYKICRVKEKTRLRDFTLNTSNVNISITKMITTYPYLLPNLRPQKILNHFNFLPDHMKQRCQFNQYLIIDHKLFVKQYVPGAISSGRLLLNYITNILHELPNMYFYHVSRDQFNMIAIKQWIQPKTDNHIVYDGLYQSAKRILVDFPLFMRSIDLASELQFNKFILVDSFLLSEHWEGNALRSRQTSAKIAFEDKQNIIFWRGAASGRLFYDDVDFYLDLHKHWPRLYAVNYSQSYPSLMDFKFTNHPHLDESIKIQYNITYEISPWTSIEDHLKYKYLISFDGWTAAWQRIPWIMMSSSILLKQFSYKVEWFYGDFIADVHFIEIKQDLSDLVSKMQYLQKNPDFAKKIIKNANQYAKRFNMAQLQTDLSNILKEYASYQQLTDDEARHLLQTRQFYWNSTAINSIPSKQQKQNIKYWIILLLIFIIVISYLIVRIRRARAISEQNKTKTIVSEVDDISTSQVQ